MVKLCCFYDADWLLTVQDAIKGDTIDQYSPGAILKNAPKIDKQLHMRLTHSFKKPDSYLDKLSPSS